MYLSVDEWNVYVSQRLVENSDFIFPIITFEFSLFPVSESLDFIYIFQYKKNSWNNSGFTIVWLMLICSSHYFHYFHAIKHEALLCNSLF